MPPKGVQDLGFVALDSYATGVVGPAAKIRASYGEGTVIPLFSNHGFLPFLRNLICSMRRLRVNNWLVIAMDNETCPALMGTPGDGEQSACVYPYSHSAIGVTTGTGVATYRSTNFNRMVMQRPLWVRWLLEHGYNVIQCDLDIVWLNDPQPALRAAKVQITKGGAVIRAMLPGVKSAKDDYANGAMYRAYGNGNVNSNEMSEAAPDLLFQSEQAYGLNGGFYFARPTKATLAFFNAWVERLTVMITMPSFEEQHALNSAILRMRRNNSADMRLLHSHLPSRAFPNGKIWWTYPVCARVCLHACPCCHLLLSLLTLLRLFLSSCCSTRPTSASPSSSTRIGTNSRRRAAWREIVSGSSRATTSNAWPTSTRWPHRATSYARRSCTQRPARR